MKSDYDVIVIGAGPAGSVAATTVAKNGLDVLLLEKRQEIGEPVRCAEGWIHDRIGDFIEYDRKWVCAEIRRARIYAPNGRTLNFSQEDPEIAGYVLDRKIFDRSLAKQAANAGSEVQVKTRATGLILENGMVRGIKGLCRGKEFEARSDIVIGADGVESKVGRWAGLMGPLRLKDIESCAEFTITGIDVEPDCLEFYFGNDISPGGYAWIFPKGEGEANVGLGILGKRFKGIHPIQYLKKFVENRYPDCSILQTIVGAVPVCDRCRRISTSGLMLVGDGARLADPLLGAGIMNAMLSGRIAGNWAAEAIKNADFSSGALKKYDDEIRLRIGNAIHRNYRLKELWMNATDRQLNALLFSMHKMHLENIPISSIYTIATSSGFAIPGMGRKLF